MGWLLSNGSNEDHLVRLVHIVENTKAPNTEFPEGRLVLESRRCILQQLTILGLDVGLMGQLLVNGLDDLPPVETLDRFQFCKRRRHDLDSEGHSDSLQSFLDCCSLLYVLPANAATRREWKTAIGWNHSTNRASSLRQRRLAC
jgi:hypothetical protein